MSEYYKRIKDFFFPDEQYLGNNNSIIREIYFNLEARKERELEDSERINKGYVRKYSLD